MINIQQIKIDKGIPLHDSKRQISPGLTQKLRDMEVGDSFFYPAVTSTLNGIIRNLRPEGIKYSTRKVTENGVLGLRVWRIK